MWAWLWGLGVLRGLWRQKGVPQPPSVCTAVPVLRVNFHIPDERSTAEMWDLGDTIIHSFYTDPWQTCSQSLELNYLFIFQIFFANCLHGPDHVNKLDMRTLVYEVALMELLFLHTTTLQIEDLPKKYCNLQIGTDSSVFENRFCLFVCFTFRMKLHESLSNMKLFFLANNF